MSIAPARQAQMDLVLENAGAAWKNQAYTFLCAYSRGHDIFSAEDVSDAHIAAGHPQPHDLRAWGGLYQRARREGYIAIHDHDGWSERRSSPCTHYRSLVCVAVAA